MRTSCYTLALILLVVAIAPQSKGNGSKTTKEDLGMMSDVDPDEPEEVREMARDRWEIAIQRDLCPWAECSFCTCNGERPMCTETPAVGYRGPNDCKKKAGVHVRQIGQCFFKHVEGGNPQMDCTMTNNDYSICFPKPTMSTEYVQQICLGFFVDCDNLIDFCNCSRACAFSSQLPATPAVTPTPMIPPRNPVAGITDRQRAPSITTPRPKAKTQPSGSENEVLRPTTRMITQRGNVVNRSDTNVSETTAMQEGTSVSTSPELQDYNGGFTSMLSSMGILALSFGGLLLVCLVFIITVVCTCTCKSHRKRVTKHQYEMKNKQPHAYYYVDVDNGVVTTDIHKGKKPAIINPVSDVRLQNSNSRTITFNTGSGGVYSEADAVGFVISAAPEQTEQTENQYAECRPKSQAVSVAPSEAATYMELNDDENAPINLKNMPNTEVRASAIYTDLHFGNEPLDDNVNRESDSETSGTSAEPEETDASSGSEVSMSSTDSGVEEQHKADSTSDFEGDNAHYFEAKTLPLPTRAKSTDSVNSHEVNQEESSKDTPQILPKDSPKKSEKIIDCSSLKKGCNYQKLRFKSSERSFSIDSTGSDNTYSALTPTDTVTIAEEDGQYSTLVREGQEGKKRENDGSDSDNTYSELKNCESKNDENEN